MKVYKKGTPAVASSDPDLLYIVASPPDLSSRDVQGAIAAIAKRITTVWVVVLDSDGTSLSVLKNLKVGNAGVIMAAQGDLTRRFYNWKGGRKPFLVVPGKMVTQINERNARFTGLISHDGQDLREKLILIGAKAQNYLDSNIARSSAPPMAAHGLTLYDLQRPGAATMKSFLNKWTATSLNRAAFIQLLEDAARVYKIPTEILVELGKLEYYGLTRSKYYSSFRGGYNKHYSGPFQIGEDHYTETKRYFRRTWGITLPPHRDRASLGVQVISSIDAVRRGANNEPALRSVPLAAVGFYLVHNQGAAGAARILGGTLTPKGREALEAQSSTVRALIKKHYNVWV